MNRINTETLYELINGGVLKAGMKLKVYKDDVILTEIMFDGYDFQWETGTLTSGDFFNPLVDFEIFEDIDLKKELSKLQSEIDLLSNEIGSYHNKIHSMRDRNNYMKEQLIGLMKIVEKVGE